MLDYAQLSTLLAINEEGTFEGAARALSISSFAVSQRVKQLEKSLGVTLVKRGPTRTSDIGKILCRHTSEVADLEQALIEKHRIACNSRGEDGAPVFRIALPEAYASDWLGRVVAKLEKFGDPPSFDVTIADPRQSAELMQSGAVVAAVSSAREPIHGFKSFRLGEIRYLAVASPDFADRYFSEGVTLDTIREAPCLRSCASDGLATDWAEAQFGRRPALSLYNCPGSRAAMESVLFGRSWSMMPAADAKPYLAGSSLVELHSHTPLIRQLYWHVSGSMVQTMSEITRIVRMAGFGSD